MLAIALAASWAHARRAIFETRESAPRTSDWLLHQIALFYRIEARLRASKTGAQLRQVACAAQITPILRRIHAALQLIRHRYLPQRARGKTITHTLDL